MAIKKIASSKTETNATSAGYTRHLPQDTLRQYGIKPYQVADSGLSVQQVYDYLNAILYKSYSPDYR
jgi:hypothetical protein